MAKHLQQLPGVLLGEVTGVTADGKPIVCVPSVSRPRPARVISMQAQPDWRQCVGDQVVLAFGNGDEDQPIVLGVLRDGRPQPAELPRTLRIAAGQELTIECGKSKIMLRADGRVEIRGEHLVSRSSGPNKVKGGSVHIN